MRRNNMEQNIYITNRKNVIGNKIVTNFKKRFFDAYYVQDRNEALKKAIELIQKEDTVSWGGSISAAETGIIDYVINNGYKVINRDLAKSSEEKYSLLRQALLCDTYIMGANAITTDGELVNIDCIGNRVGALMFGPKSVIVIVGMNKVCRNLEEAVNRARNTAAPVNMQRISEKAERMTPCCKSGECHNCISKDSICSHITITRLCNPENRIKVILVGESLGF